MNCHSPLWAPTVIKQLPVEWVSTPFVGQASPKIVLVHWSPGRLQPGICSDVCLQGNTDKNIDLHIQQLGAPLISKPQKVWEAKNFRPCASPVQLPTMLDTINATFALPLMKFPLWLTMVARLVPQAVMFCWKYWVANFSVYPRFVPPPLNYTVCFSVPGGLHSCTRMTKTQGIGVSSNDNYLTCFEHWISIP